MTDDVAEVLALERSRLRSLVERDMVVADRIHAPDYELITPGGHTRTKATYLCDVASKRLEYLACAQIVHACQRAIGNERKNVRSLGRLLPAGGAPGAAWLLPVGAPAGAPGPTGSQPNVR